MTINGANSKNSSNASNASNANSTIGSYGSKAFIAKWTLLMVLGLLAEFIARFFSFSENPLGIYIEPLVTLSGIAPILVGALGVYLLSRACQQSQSMPKRQAALVIMLGVVMLAGFFAFQSIIPQIF